MLGYVVVAVALTMAAGLSAGSAFAVEPAVVDRESEAALKTLYEGVPAAKELGAKAMGILVFPNIVKAGFIFGVQYGDGELLTGGRPAGYYNITALSYGFQAGVQAFGYAMFFMTASALSYLNQSGGFEIGVGPSIVAIDQGFAKTFTTSTIQSDIYSFVFDQKGLMGGSERTRVEDHKDKSVMPLLGG